MKSKRQESSEQSLFCILIRQRGMQQNQGERKMRTSTVLHHLIRSMISHRIAAISRGTGFLLTTLRTLSCLSGIMHWRLNRAQSLFRHVCSSRTTALPNFPRSSEEPGLRARSDTGNKRQTNASSDRSQDTYSIAVVSSHHSL